MKSTIKAALVLFVVLMLVPEKADAVFGVRRRTACRTAVVVGSSVHAADMAAASSSSSQAQQQTAAAQQQTAQAQQQTAQAQQQTAEAQKAAAATPAAATTSTPAPAPATGAGKLPLGTVVPSLPPGCVSTPVNGVEYYYSNGNFYRAVFQGNSLVYVTADPK